MSEKKAEYVRQESTAESTGYSVENGDMQDLADAPIPALLDINWDEVFRVPIRENGESLVRVEDIGDGLRCEPIYYRSNLPGAVEDCYLRAEAYRRLRQASELLPDGYSIVILDGWRTIELQRYLFDEARKRYTAIEPKSDASIAERNVSAFVAPPSDSVLCPSPHLTGGAVDLTLAGPDGSVLYMGGEFDELDRVSYTRHYEHDSLEVRRYPDERTQSVERQVIEARRNRRLLFHIMCSVGFVNYPNEWWHFDYGDQLWAWVNGVEAMYGPARRVVNG